MGGQLPKTPQFIGKRLETKEIGRGRKDFEREEVVKKIITSDGGI